MFDYNSRFARAIENCILKFNELYPEESLCVSFYKSDKCDYESSAGSADYIIHSGGEGDVVKEDIFDIPKLYICHSHQRKDKKEGGKIKRLFDYHKGVECVDVIKNDRIFGKAGKMSIMQYHCLAVTKVPSNAHVLAVSRAKDYFGQEVNVVEALKYDDKTISVQGHPEEGTAFHIIHNFLKIPF